MATDLHLPLRHHLLTKVVAAKPEMCQYNRLVPIHPWGRRLCFLQQNEGAEGALIRSFGCPKSSGAFALAIAVESGCAFQSATLFHQGLGLGVGPGLVDPDAG